MTSTMDNATREVQIVNIEYQVGVSALRVVKLEVLIYRIDQQGGELVLPQPDVRLLRNLTFVQLTMRPQLLFHCRDCHSLNC